MGLLFLNISVRKQGYSLEIVKIYEKEQDVITLSETGRFIEKV